MRKTLICLSILGLLGAPLFAASTLDIGDMNVVTIDAGDVNVSLYGHVDVGYNIGFNNAYGMNNRYGLDSGVGMQSYLGIKGYTGLNENLTAGFLIEGGVAIDSDLSDLGQAILRQGYVYFSHDKYGTIRFGKQQSAQYELLEQFDPFALRTDASVNRNYSINSRVANATQYISPDFGGFVVKAAYSFNNLFDEDMLGESNFSTFFISPSFKYENFSIAGAFTLNHFHMNIPVDEDGDPIANIPMESHNAIIWDIMASYDFGPVKAFGGFGMRDTDGKGDFFFPMLNLANISNITNSQYASLGLGNDKTTQWYLGVQVPVFENGTVMAAFTDRKVEFVSRLRASDAKS